MNGTGWPIRTYWMQSESTVWPEAAYVVEDEGKGMEEEGEEIDKHGQSNLVSRRNGRAGVLVTAPVMGSNPK